MQKKPSTLFSVIFAVIITAVISISATIFFTTRSTPVSDSLPVYTKFVSIYNSIKSEFLYDSDLDNALDEAYKAFFLSLDDSFSRYFFKKRI